MIKLNDSFCNNTSKYKKLLEYRFIAFYILCNELFKLFCLNKKKLIVKFFFNNFSLFIIFKFIKK